MRHLYFGEGSQHNYVMKCRHECTHNAAETMFDIITISIININLKCSKVFPSFIIYHNKLLTYSTKLHSSVIHLYTRMTRQLLSYFPVIVACKYFKMFNSFINTYKINLDSFCGLSSKKKNWGRGRAEPPFLNIGGL